MSSFFGRTFINYVYRAGKITNTHIQLAKVVQLRGTTKSNKLFLYEFMFL